MNPLKDLELQINKFLNSSRGKVAVKKALMSQPSGFGAGAFSSAVKVNEAALAKAADSMKDILSKRLEESGLGSMTQYVSSTGMRSDHVNGLYFEIVVPDFALERESLYPEKYPRGAYNIITLFEKGWSTGNQIRFWKMRCRNLTAIGRHAGYRPLFL